MVSAGWTKGMEMWASLLAWGMLGPDQGGGQTIDDDIVAYYEPLPNEARTGFPVTFDAAGTCQYAATGSRQLVPAAALEYAWDFSDGATGSEQRAAHSYEQPGVCQS